MFVLISDVGSGKPQQQVEVVAGLGGKAGQGGDTRFDLFDYGFVVLDLHLPDDQEHVGGVLVVGQPVVAEEPRATTATVHHDAVAERLD